MLYIVIYIVLIYIWTYLSLVFREALFQKFLSDNTKASSIEVVSASLWTHVWLGYSLFRRLPGILSIAVGGAVYNSPWSFLSVTQLGEVSVYPVHLPPQELSMKEVSVNTIFFCKRLVFLSLTLHPNIKTHLFTSLIPIPRKSLWGI